MGMAAHEHHLLHGKGKIDGKILGHQGDQPGQITASVLCHRPIHKGDASLSRGLAAGEQIEKGGFAAAVWADDPVKLAWLKRDVQIGQRRGLPVGKADPGQLQNRCLCS